MASNEKGTFFEGEIELKLPFDIQLLELHYDEVDGEEIVNRVVYDGEEIDNWGGSTDGKSSDMNMVLLTSDDGEFERYEPEEKDWGHPPYGVSPSDWESSPKFKFKKQKPTVPGYYWQHMAYVVIWWLMALVVLFLPLYSRWRERAAKATPKTNQGAL